MNDILRMQEALKKKREENKSLEKKIAERPTEKDLEEKHVLGVIPVKLRSTPLQEQLDKRPSADEVEERGIADFVRHMCAN